MQKKTVDVVKFLFSSFFFGSFRGLNIRQVSKFPFKRTYWVSTKTIESCTKVKKLFNERGHFGRFF